MKRFLPARTRGLLLAVPVIAGFLFLSACSRGRISSVARTDLFGLEIGPLDNQVNLSNMISAISDHRASLAMRDGLFYISDTFGKKIVRYTSFGDLLFVIYNDLESPPPITLRHGIEDEGVATRWSIAYPLREPGFITVDSKKHIYAVDKVEPDRKIFDNEEKALLDSAVLHFDDSGRFVNFLGQEGVGGKPFPRISGIYASLNDEIAVVCLLSSGWNIYWFNSEGTLLYLVHLRRDSIPASGNNGSSFSSVDSIIAAPDTRKLFLKVDYYAAAEANAPAVPDSSVIWIMNVENGAYEESVNVPFFEHTTVENNQKVTQRMFYVMLGVIKNDRVFLYFPVDSGYSLLVLTAGSREQRLGFIQVKNDELEYNTFNLSAEGILSGLVATNWDARLVWWRTDHLLGEMNL
ncbi:MAG: hypothetical protein LBI67_07390 [Treponema sp.]|jgi:hypothetical protein|nr:hypothetical protein [Treponema sp.]